MFTLGGGYAMIPIIDREVVKKRSWLEQEEFMDILAIAQSAPGLLIVNISIFAGYRLRGKRGSVAATIGSCLPSFLIILAIALFFVGFKENIYVDKFFKGVRPVVVALIAVPVIDMIKKSNLDIFRALIAVATAAAIIWLKLSPIYILLTGAVLFFLSRWAGWLKREKGRSEKSDKQVDS
ncbi:MAG: chromate transporter [Bacteroidales bacterium]|nr:chromate transporter [Bacteroidales bacterium]